MADHDLLAEKHKGMRISADGLLGRIRDGRYYKELNYGCGGGYECDGGPQCSDDHK
jgi:hypothetical protein